MSFNDIKFRKVDMNRPRFINRFPLILILANPVPNGLLVSGSVLFLLNTPLALCKQRAISREVHGKLA
jgi:hypothetical protein